MRFIVVTFAVWTKLWNQNTGGGGAERDQEIHMDQEN